MTQFAEETISLAPNTPVPLTRSVYAAAGGSRAQMARIAVIETNGGRPTYRFGAAPELTGTAPKYFYGPQAGRYMDVKGFDSIASIQLALKTGSYCKLYIGYFE